MRGGGGRVSGFRVQGSGFRVWGLGFRGWGFGLPRTAALAPDPQSPPPAPHADVLFIHESFRLYLDRFVYTLIVLFIHESTNVVFIHYIKRFVSQPTFCLYINKDIHCTTSVLSIHEPIRSCVIVSTPHGHTLFTCSDSISESIYDQYLVGPSFRPRCTR